MNYAEFAAKYKLKINVLSKPAPGIGLLSGTMAQVNGKAQASVIVTGSSNSYMNILFAGDEHCLALYSAQLRSTKAYTSDQRAAILNVLNGILHDLESPVEIVYDATYYVFVLYNKQSCTWSFKLEYTYKSSKFLECASYSRVEPLTWQLPGRAQSNTLEGKFDPDVSFESSALDDTVKLITENLA